MLTFLPISVTLPVRAPHRERALCKQSIWQANIRVRLSHRRFERRTAQIVVQNSERTRSAVTPPVRESHSADRCANCRFGKRTYAFCCHTASSSGAHKTRCANCRLASERTRSAVCSSVAQRRSLCKLSVWQANVRVRLSHLRCTVQSVVQTVGLANERTRSAPVREVHSSERCANCRFGKRRSPVTPPVRASHSADRCANCRFGKRTYAFGCQTAGAQLVWKANVRVRRLNRRFANSAVSVTSLMTLGPHFDRTRRKNDLSVHRTVELLRSTRKTRTPRPQLLDEHAN